MLVSVARNERSQLLQRSFRLFIQRKGSGLNRGDGFLELGEVDLGLLELSGFRDVFDSTQERRQMSTM
jgi:hypothetical protein